MLKLNKLLAVIVELLQNIGLGILVNGLYAIQFTGYTTGALIAIGEGVALLLGAIVYKMIKE